MHFIHRLFVMEVKYKKTLLKDFRALVQALHVLAIDFVVHAEYFQAGGLILLAIIIAMHFEEEI